MKRVLYIISLLAVFGIISISCAVDKKCPAYTKMNKQKVEKVV